MRRKGSEGKVDGAFGPEGCIEGLCPQRGNDSLHFARRYRSFKMCSLCIHGKACHTILRSLCSLTARLSPTHNILRVTAFLQNMFAGVTRVPLPPHPGDRINRSALLCRVMWRSHQRGCCFSIAQKARLPGFSSYQPPDHPDSSRSAPPTGIYQQMPHHRRSPRSFAVAQDDKREAGLPSPQSILPV